MARTLSGACGAACSFVLWICAAAASETLDPLALTPAQPEETDTPLGLRAELWRQQFDVRRAGTTQPDFQNRFVLDFRREWQPGEGFKLGLSDRFEVIRAPGNEETRNALREIYASRAFGATRFVDAGRINWRNGVASGFNPTDYLKRNAVIEQGTNNPQALRENRLGTVMLRGQWVGAPGSMQLALIPDLAHGAPTPDDSLAPAWDRTNERQAALLKLAPQLGERITADMLAFARAGAKPQFGANVTALLGDAWVAYVEASGGRTQPLAGPNEPPPPRAWKNAVAAGLTWTSPPGIVATLEYQYSGDALTRERWAAWQQTIGTPLEAQLGRLRNERSRALAPLAQRAWFGRLAWDDAFGSRNLALAAFLRVNTFDHSRLWQLDGSWYLSGRQSLRAIVGGYAGAARSEFGTAPLARYGSLSWVLFL
jgi:hypothetical protein